LASKFKSGVMSGNDFQHSRCPATCKTDQKKWQKPRKMFMKTEVFYLWLDSWSGHIIWLIQGHFDKRRKRVTDCFRVCALPVDLLTNKITAVCASIFRKYFTDSYNSFCRSSQLEAEFYILMPLFVYCHFSIKCKSQMQIWLHLVLVVNCSSVTSQPV
jgi:hypothetical protein